MYENALARTHFGFVYYYLVPSRYMDAVVGSVHVTLDRLHAHLLFLTAFTSSTVTVKLRATYSM